MVHFNEDGGIPRLTGVDRRYVKESVDQRFGGVPKKDPAHGDMIVGSSPAPDAIAARDGPADWKTQDEFRRHGLTQRECELEIAIQMPAGSDTSTTAIRDIMLYLMSTPHAYQKLKKEIGLGIKEGRISSPITNEEAKQLPYLQVRLHEIETLCGSS